jgi:hypothetical protein
LRLAAEASVPIHACITQCPKNDTRRPAAKTHLPQVYSRHELIFSVFASRERMGLELSMRPTLAVAIVLALFLSGGAEGADLIQLAEIGDFLLGNAYRCGVPTDPVEHAGQFMP